MIIGDTAAHTPITGQCFRCIHCVSQTVIAAMTVDATAPITGTLVGATLSAGMIFYGKITSITLTSGDIIAYNGLL